MEYWVWWKGALALGALTVFFVFMLGRMMGVSGSWSSVINWRSERERHDAARAFAANTTVTNDALMAATLAEFGEAKTQQLLAAQGAPFQSSAAINAPRVTAKPTVAWTAHLTFLLFMLVGGSIAAIVSGRFDLRLDLGAVHTRFFGTGWHEWLALMLGGTLVGFGTQMGGGCTSGHGLSGVSRLTPASLIATASFFLSAVAVSFILEGYLS